MEDFSSPVVVNVYEWTYCTQVVREIKMICIYIYMILDDEFQGGVFPRFLREGGGGGGGCVAGLPP